jgi:hypothetical protein
LLCRRTEEGGTRRSSVAHHPLVRVRVRDGVRVRGRDRAGVRVWVRVRVRVRVRVIIGPLVPQSLVGACWRPCTACST